uniref:FAD-binding domain-containing protein n=1 Tax=Triticum urartu TaxID=4572 RepID=A0A8R7TIL6_TRIUA
MADRGGKAPAWTSAAAAVDVDAEVVIVGAGIAGLATALALRRLGVGAAGGGVLVLERHAELRSPAPRSPLPQRLVRAPCARRRAQAHLPLRCLRNIPGDNSGDWSDAGVPLCWAQKQQRRRESETDASEGAAGGARGGAASGHHQVLVQARLDRHREGAGFPGDRRPTVRRRYGDPIQGADRVRRGALRGVAVAGPVGAGELRPVRRPRARRVPGRPWPQEGAPAVPLGGSQGRHGAHQRHRCLLVPRQQHHPGREGGRHGPRQDPAGGHGQPGQAHAGGVPGRGAPLRLRQPVVGAAAVPRPLGHPQGSGGPRARHGGPGRGSPHDPPTWRRAGAPRWRTRWCSRALCLGRPRPPTAWPPTWQSGVAGLPGWSPGLTCRAGSSRAGPTSGACEGTWSGCFATGSFTGSCSPG